MQRYYDISDPASFGGVDRLYNAMKRIGWSKKDVKEFLKDQNTYTLHKERRYSFRRNKIITYHKDFQHQIDLMDMRQYSEVNDGYKYILVIIDCFTRYCWLKPLKEKSAKALEKAFEDIYSNDAPIPIRIQTDQGREFTNSVMKKWYEKHEILFFTTKGPGFKCAMVERLNRTLKNRLFRYFTKIGTHRYIDVLDKLAYSYNNSYHRSIKMTPEAARNSPPENLSINFTEPQNKLKNKFKIGDKVRIAYDYGKMDRGFMQTFQDPILTISRILKKNDVPVYELKDYFGNIIKRRYYAQQLQLVGDVPYRIERIIRERTNRQTGRKQYLVKFIGYPDPEWVDELEDV